MLKECWEVLYREGGFERVGGMGRAGRGSNRG